MNGKLAKSFVNLERGRAASSTTTIPFLMTWHSNSHDTQALLNTLFTTLKFSLQPYKLGILITPFYGGVIYRRKKLQRAEDSQSYPTLCGDGEVFLVPASYRPSGKNPDQGRTLA